MHIPSIKFRINLQPQQTANEIYIFADAPLINPHPINTDFSQELPRTTLAQHSRQN
jgi:hypothetical protein